MYFFGKKDVYPIISTSYYLGPGVSHLGNSVCFNGSHMDVHRICDVTICSLFQVYFQLGAPRC